MKLILLVFSILLLYILSECTPQDQDEHLFHHHHRHHHHQHQHRRPRPTIKPLTNPHTNPLTNPTSPTKPLTLTTTTSRPSSTPPRTTQSEEFYRCLQNCPTTSEYNPVCGSNQMVYQNMGKFVCAQNCGADATFVRRGNCAGLF